MIAASKYTTLLWLLWLGSSLLTAQAPETPSSGDQLYLKNDYTQAIIQYQQELIEGHSFRLHYNLANAYYQNGDSARAILHYRKALILQPRNADAQANLNLAYQTAGLTAPSRNFLDPLAQLLPINTWVIIACLSFWWLALYLCLLPKRSWLTGLSALTLISLLLSAAAMGAYHLTGKEGIILQESSLTVAPSPQAEVLKTVPAGTLAQSIDTFKDYQQIQLPQKKQKYWISQEHFAPIWE